MINTYLARITPVARTDTLREINRWAVSRGEHIEHWLTEEAWETVDAQELEAYLETLAPAVGRKARGAFRALLNLVDRDDLDGPFSYRRRPGTVILTDEQCNQLLATIDGESGASVLRDGVALALLIDTGMLATEVTSVSWADVRGDLVTVNREEGAATFRLSSRTMTALNAWRTLTGGIGTIVRRVGRYGTIYSSTITPQALNQIVARAGQRIGVEQLGAADLRRSWLARAHAGGVPIELIDVAEG